MFGISICFLFPVFGVIFCMITFSTLTSMSVLAIDYNTISEYAKKNPYIIKSYHITICEIKFTFFNSNVIFVSQNCIRNVIQK